MTLAAPALDRDFEAFLAAYPAFASTGRLDEVRAAEYSRLDRGGHVYLDFAGGGLYADSQPAAHLAMLAEGVFGNPHSGSPAAELSAGLADRARREVLRYFRGSPEEYAVVFTANASGALRLVGESYPFHGGGHLLLTADNHNSVNGIREFAGARGTPVTYVPLTLPDLRVDDALLDRHLGLARSRGGNLFAYPAQSNFSGVQHPLAWIERAHERGWDVLLDAAGFAATGQLDLGRHHPDYVDLSFYKMFGYPTGVGCLIARRDALLRLRRPWFAGGTLEVASVQARRHALAEGEAGFEDGTIDYLGLPAVEIGLRHLESIGMETVRRRVCCLTGWLLDRLSGLRHGNGRPMVRLYGPATVEARGGTVALNFCDADGRPRDHREIGVRAAAAGISLRTGCFCNPGSAETAFGITAAEVSACFRQAAGARLTHQDFARCIPGKPSGAVRVSLGLASNFADVERFLECAGSLRES
jgi:molybdenum cofactor sulfurtransferase